MCPWAPNPPMETFPRMTAAPTQTTPFRMNPLASREAPWTAAQDAILSDAGLEAARATITGWPDYAPTPLHDLKGLAAELGMRYVSLGLVVIAIICGMIQIMTVM